MWLKISIAIIVILVVLIIVIFNKLVTLRQRVKNSWGQINVQLQRRFDLIPNLVETVKGYMEHEQEVLTKVTDLRSSWASANTVSQKSELDTELSNALKSIMAVSENYPDLKANKSFSDLQSELKNTEDKIAYSRQFYNDIVTKYNTKREVFPSNIIASIFGFKEEELFKVQSEDSKKVVNVNIK